MLGGLLGVMEEGEFLGLEITRSATIVKYSAPVQPRFSADSKEN